VSVLAGNVSVGGSAKYLSERKDSFRSAESTLLLNVNTVTEQVDLRQMKVRDDLKNIPATHVVAKIYWGANCAMTVTDQNSDEDEKTEVEAKLSVNLEKLKSVASASASAGTKFSREDKEQWNRYFTAVYSEHLIIVFGIEKISSCIVCRQNEL